MRELVFWGATGQAKVLREALSRADYRLVALVDNRDVISPFVDVPVLRGEVGLDQWLDERGGPSGLFCAAAVGGARGRGRLKIMTLLKRKGLTVLTVIHPTAFVAADVAVGEGCQILAKSAVCTDGQLGRGVIVNTAAAVDHDCVIGAGVHLAPGVRLAGEVTVGERAFIGMGAIVLPHLKIGADAIVGAGAVVTRDVLPNVTVIGNPARIRENNV